MGPLKIANLKLKNRLFLAPMLDVTDLPYRLICRKCGVGMAYTEMIYVNAILHSNKKTEQMLKTCSLDKPIGLQITGNNEEEFEKFVKLKKVWKDFDLIDLNCGCPSSRIVGNKAGSYLLNSPEKIGRIVKILKKTGKSVTVKTRLGFNKVNVLEVAKIVEEAGASALTVHCRLAVDGNDVRADWSYLSKVKKVVKIPVMGNGDVFSGADASEMLKVCDGVMIGRGAIGNPLIFRDINRYLESRADGIKESYASRNCSPMSLRSFGSEFIVAHSVRRRLVANERLSRRQPAGPRGSSDSLEVGEISGEVAENLKLFLEYLRLEEKYFGENADLGKVKYIGGKFLRGFSGAPEARNKLMGMKSFDEIRKFINEEILIKIWQS